MSIYEISHRESSRLARRKRVQYRITLKVPQWCSMNQANIAAASSWQAPSSDTFPKDNEQPPWLDLGQPALQLLISSTTKHIIEKEQIDTRPRPADVNNNNTNQNPIFRTLNSDPKMTWFNYRKEHFCQRRALNSPLVYVSCLSGVEVTIRCCSLSSSLLKENLNRKSCVDESEESSSCWFTFRSHAAKLV